MLGLTLATVTVCEPVLLSALSESFTCTETMLDAGPSGKTQSKLPPDAVVIVVPSWLPAAPQLNDTTLNVSWPGSTTVKSYVCVVPSSTDNSFDSDNVTVGATLFTVTSTESESDAPSLSLIVTDAMLDAGPSGNKQSKLPAPVAPTN